LIQSMTARPQAARRRSRFYGDPDKAGPFAFRLKFPPGYKVAAHMHPNDHDVTVLSGTMYLGMGEKLDTTRGQPLIVGGYLHLPKGTHHYEWTTDDTVIQLQRSRTGRDDIEWERFALLPIVRPS
jgi:quercetin dioxygenase-like cupin family protein